MSGTWRGTSYGYSRKPCQSGQVSANISQQASRPPGPLLPLGTAKCPADPLPGTSEGGRRTFDNYTACPTYYGAESASRVDPGPLRDDMVNVSGQSVMVPARRWASQPDSVRRCAGWTVRMCLNPRAT